MKSLRTLLRGGSQTNRSSSLLVCDYLDAWLDGKRALRPSTRLAYRIHVRMYLSPALGHLRLTSLAPAHIEHMYTVLLEDREERSAVSTSTLTRVHATLMSALNTAVRRGLINRNPAALIELPQPARPELTVWSPQELSRFLEVVGDDDLYPLFVLLVLCGLRRGEAVGLRWRDVDLEHGCLHVRQQLVAVGSAVITGAPKSRAGHRLVVLDCATITLMECHRREQDRRLKAAGERWPGNDLVFTTRTGEPLDPAGVSRRFDRLVTRSGLPRIRLHDLRHTSASIGLASGESLIEVSRRLGHSSIAVTADIYSHVSTDQARQAAERRSQHIFNR